MKQWTVYEDVWVTYFCWSNREMTEVAKASRKNSRVVLRHGRTCSKIRWGILRAGKQESGARSWKNFRGHCACVEELPAWPVVVRCTDLIHSSAVRLSKFRRRRWILQLHFEKHSTGSQTRLPSLRRRFVRATFFLHALSTVRVFFPSICTTCEIFVQCCPDVMLRVLVFFRCSWFAIAIRSNESSLAPLLLSKFLSVMLIIPVELSHMCRRTFLFALRTLHFSTLFLWGTLKMELTQFLMRSSLFCCCWSGSTTTQMAKIMVQYGRPSCSSWTKSVRSSFGRTIMGKAIWENPFETWLEENSKLGMSLCTSWKRIIIICVFGWHKIGWKETKSWSDVESTQ